jgi:hypothetical protein
MKQERRDALKNALMMAILTATPASILAASKRARDPSQRFLWLELPGRSFLSLDTANQDRAYLLSTSLLADGKYSLRGGRALVVRAGRLARLGDSKLESSMLAR